MLFKLSYLVGACLLQQVTQMLRVLRLSRAAGGRSMPAVCSSRPSAPRRSRPPPPRLPPPARPGERRAALRAPGLRCPPLRAIPLRAAPTNLPSRGADRRQPRSPPLMRTKLQVRRLPTPSPARGDNPTHICLALKTPPVFNLYFFFLFRPRY